VSISSFSDKPFLVSLTLAGNPSGTVSTALVDSGAVENFIDHTLVSSLNITSYPLSSLFPVQALGNRSLGSGTITHITTPLTFTVEPFHQENIILLIISAPAHKIILGLPWLQCHNPTIS
jgi:hypothetical protein